MQKTRSRSDAGETDIRYPEPLTPRKFSSISSVPPQIIKSSSLISSYQCALVAAESSARTLTSPYRGANMSAQELELAVLYAYNPPGVGEEAARVKAQVTWTRMRKNTAALVQLQIYERHHCASARRHSLYMLKGPTCHGRAHSQYCSLKIMCCINQQLRYEGRDQLWVTAVATSVDHPEVTLAERNGFKLSRSHIIITMCS